jgi:hypothetical protein
MKSPYVSYAGRAPKVVATHVVALYDETGRIHHSHTVHIHEGGRSISEDEAVEGAYRHAGRLGHDTSRLKLKISKNPDHGHFPHAIDLTSGEFVPIKRLRNSTE